VEIEVPRAELLAAFGATDTSFESTPSL